MPYGRRFRWIAGLTVFALSMILVASSADDLPRFREVRAGLYRGGQPTQSGWLKLQRMGIRTVISLSENSTEKRQVETMGMKFVHIPIDAPLIVDPWKEVPAQDVEHFFEVARDPASQPVFVHCERGADRTGVMIGLYRIAFDRWTPEAAYDEARDIGLRWWYRGYRNQLFEFQQPPEPNPSGLR